MPVSLFLGFKSALVYKVCLFKEMNFIFMLFRTEFRDLVDIIPALYSQDSEFMSQPEG